MNWKHTLLICGLILLGGGALLGIIFSTEPTAQRSGATQETAMLVDVTDVERGTYTPTIRAMGTVMPSQDITLSPRVSGVVIERSPNFTPGGFVEKGETLLQIDPSDYKNTLQQRRSELQQAISDLNIEMGRQDVALKDYQLVEDTLSAENRELVLREPQLESARASVQSARAAVDQAELELERTTIRAPFDAHILSRNVNVGSQVSPGNNLGRLVGQDSYWVEATVPLSHLRWLTFPDGNGQGSDVTVRNRTAWGPEEHREGQLYRLVGSLVDRTRMARVLITVPDPRGYRAKNSDKPTLIIGSFLEANIQAEQLSDVIRLNRDYIRQDGTVWVMENGMLNIKDVEIAFRDAQYAYIQNGLNEQDQVVTSNLTTVADGAALRLEESNSNAQQDTLSTTGR